MEEIANSNNPSAFVDSLKAVFFTTSIAGAHNDEIVALKKVNEFLKACTSSVASKIESVEKAKKESNVSGGGFGQLLLSMDQVQFLEPRGRFDMKIFSSGLSFDSKTTSGFIPWPSVLNILCVVNNMSAKKDSEDLVALHFEAQIINKKSVTNICMALSRAPPKPADPNASTGLSPSEIVQGLLKDCVPHKISKPSPKVFITTKSEPFLRCYNGLQEGSLYLLGSGILFLKPVVFIPVDKIASVGAGRGGSATTRYVDLKVITDMDKEYEFSNIDRDELMSIQGYVSYLEAKRSKLNEMEESNVGKKESKSEPQEAVTPTPINMEAAVDVVMSPKKSKSEAPSGRPKRAAALVAISLSKEESAKNNPNEADNDDDDSDGDGDYSEGEDTDFDPYEIRSDHGSDSGSEGGNDGNVSGGEEEGGSDSSQSESDYSGSGSDDEDSSLASDSGMEDIAEGDDEERPAKRKKQG